MDEMARRRRSIKPFFKATDLHLIFYSIVFLLALACIAALLAVSYAGSPWPSDLIHSANFKFSYNGRPTYTYLYSNHFYAGMSGTKDTVTNFTIGGDGNISISSAGDIAATYANGSTFPLGKGKLRIALRPGDEAKVYISVSRSDEINYNMRLNYTNPSPGWAADSGRGPGVTWIVRKSGDSYVINANYLAGNYTKFQVIDTVEDGKPHEPCWDFDTLISLNRSGGNDRRDAADEWRSLRYTGTISVESTGNFSLRSPVQKLGEMYCDRLKLDNAEGDLDIQHNEHKCNLADKIAIVRGEPDEYGKAVGAALLCGHVTAAGNASRLDFREKSFEEPFIVIIKEGNFTLLTTLLASFATVMLGRVLAIVRKK